MERFRDRAEAGRRLSDPIARLDLTFDPIVVGLARGGVTCGAALADALGLPLDVLVVRKLGMPGQPELAFGAIASGGVVVLNSDLAGLLTEDQIEAVKARENDELRRRIDTYGGGDVTLAGRDVVVVDDGLATGATMKVALTAIRQASPHRLVAAVPVASAATLAAVGGLADEVVSILVPTRFRSVGEWYVDFRQVEDRDVVAALDFNRTNRST